MSLPPLHPTHCFLNQFYDSSDWKAGNHLQTFVWLFYASLDLHTLHDWLLFLNQCLYMVVLGFSLTYQTKVCSSLEVNLCLCLGTSEGIKFQLFIQIIIIPLVVWQLLISGNRSCGGPQFFFFWVLAKFCKIKILWRGERESNA